MKIFCTCKHPKTRHAALYGEAGTGECFDCDCPEMRPERWVLFTHERRLLAKIAETGKIGYEVLFLQLRADGDSLAESFDATFATLCRANYIDYVGRTISATDAGRRYLEEHQPRV